MPRPPSPDLLALELSKLRKEPLTDATRAALRAALAHKSNLVAAKAAELAADLNLPDLAPDLERAFDRFFSQDDKGCLAKLACIAALHRLGAAPEPLLLRGLHHTQPEPSFGGPSDAAGPLRSTCALALASRGCSPAVLADLADLLADPLPPCRSAAARALAHTNHDAAALPLRLKILTGDPDPAVTEDCLAALVSLTPKPAAPFLIRLLNSTNDPDARAPLLIALGTTRTDAALDHLTHCYDRDLTPATRATLLQAIALTRLPRAIDFLIDVVTTAHPALAATAIDALVPYRADKNVLSRVGKALARRDEKELLSRFDARFVTT